LFHNCLEFVQARLKRQLRLLWSFFRFGHVFLF
jgi:hypothetical protein